MPNNQLGEPRRSQIVYNFGPGAIVDFRASGGSGAAISVVVGGMESWDEFAPPAGLANQQITTEPRLQEQLGVKGFRLPPVSGENEKNPPYLMGVRFPRWLICRYCHRLRQAKDWEGGSPGDPALYCRGCQAKNPEKGKVYVGPVGFVVACRKGHLDEFPWLWYCHGGQSCESPDLTLEQGSQIGLAGLILKCTKCGKRRSMEGVCGRNTLKDMKIFCHGNRPWLGDREECEEPETNRVLLRGASNLYFPVTASALDIPPWSDAIQHKLGVHWDALKDHEEEQQRQLIDLLRLEEKLNVTADEIVAQVRKGKAALEASGNKELRYEEYEQLVGDGQTTLGERVEFEILGHEPPPELGAYFGNVVQAKRLREVRAIKSFTRIVPPSSEAFEDDPDFGAIQRGENDWLPAIEVRGEGIFLTLNETSLETWEERDDVKDRAEMINKNWIKDWLDRHDTEEDPPQEITPRFILIHSLAHILIRQLSKECGYAGASLRERLYIDSGELAMCGLLVYTATPDADGTLGGLVRQGKPERLAELIPAAIQSARWCSNDPLCIKDIQTFSDPLNLAACHSCLMVSETSCEKFNRLLDRAFLVGEPGNPELGYFSPLLSHEEEL